MPLLMFRLLTRPVAAPANREQRVRDNGVPAHQSLSRTTLIAAAVSTCCRCALACPI